MPCKYASKIAIACSYFYLSRSADLRSQLRQLRLDLLQSLCNPTLETVTVRDLFDRYISLLTGFITAPEGASDDSKLRYTTKFYWSDSLTKTDVITYECLIIALPVANRSTSVMYKTRSSKSAA